MDCFYKYTSIEALYKILVQRSVWFANPINYNDILEGSFNNRQIVGKLKKWAEQHSELRRQRPESDSYSDIRDFLEKNERLAWITHHSALHHKEIVMQLSKYRIFCVSDKCDSPSMWGHYSSSGKGICIGFRHDSKLFDGKLTRPDVEVVGFYQVKYRSAKPIFHSNSTLSQQVRALTTKSTEWKHESEYRTIYRLNSSPQFIHNPSGYFFPILEGDIAEIHYGHKLDPWEVLHLYRLCKSLYPSTKHYLSVPSIPCYSIEKHYIENELQILMYQDFFS